MGDFCHKIKLQASESVNGKSKSGPGNREHTLEKAPLVGQENNRRKAKELRMSLPIFFIFQKAI